MKNKFIVGMLTLGISMNAHAWSISIGPIHAKGDDPKVIVDVVEGAKKAGTEAANGVRDAVAAVGNATGISDIINSNTETLANLGRIYACQATLCYSEVVRQKQIDEAKEEVTKELERAKAEYMANYQQKDLEERKQLAKTALDAAGKKYDLIVSHQSILEQEKRVISGFMTAVDAEVGYRKKLAENNISARPIPYRDMEKSIRNYNDQRGLGYSKAMSQVNEDIAAVSKATGRSNYALMAEFLRLAEVQTLEDILADAKLEILSINQEHKTLDKERMDVALDLVDLETAYRTGNY